MAGISGRGVEIDVDDMDVPGIGAARAYCAKVILVAGNPFPTF
jgi:hypothetical protein